MSKILQAAALASMLALFSGCTTIAQLAYDDRVQHDAEACKRLLDNSAYRQCMERVNAARAEAAKARK